MSDLIEQLPANDTIADELATKIINAKFGTKACGTLMTEPLSNGKGYIVAEYDRDEEMQYHEGVLRRGKRWGERNSAQAIATLTAENERLREALREIVDCDHLHASHTIALKALAAIGDE